MSLHLAVYLLLHVRRDDWQAEKNAAGFVVPVVVIHKVTELKGLERTSRDH